MTPRRAAKIDNSQHEIAAALTASGCVVVNISAVGDGKGDLIAILPDGRVAIMVECKTPGNVDFTPAEVRFIVSLIPPAYRVVLTGEQAIEMITKAIGEK